MEHQLGSLQKHVKSSSSSNQGNLFSNKMDDRRNQSLVLFWSNSFLTNKGSIYFLHYCIFQSNMYVIIGDILVPDYFLARKLRRVTVLVNLLELLPSVIFWPESNLAPTCHL